jgi:hypothetical protein
MSAWILMHNIDVMHQERNMGESIISTCMGFPSKTKDNMKARQDLAELCNHPSLEIKVNGGKSCTSFCLKPQQRKEVMQWDEGAEIPRWLGSWHEMFREYDDREGNWVEES